MTEEQQIKDAKEKTPELVKLETVSLKNHPQLDEKWVKDRIAADPSILGISGDLILRDREKSQPGAGILDLLLQDTNDYNRYEVEVQLGKTDASHIIRTIEYWDLERKLHPQFDHCAVIVAEEISGRLFNVISLFHGFIPLIAIQVRCLKFKNQMSLLFTTVMRRQKEEDEGARVVADRASWEKWSTKSILAMADHLLSLIKSFDSSFELNYTTAYINLAQNGQANNFASFVCQKKALILRLKMERSEEINEKLEHTELDLMEDDRWGNFRLRLKNEDVKKYEELLTDLLKAAYEYNK